MRAVVEKDSMKKQLQDILVNKYPMIFKNIGGDPRETCMAWGIECGDGWFQILDALCSVITNSVENINYRHSDTVPNLNFVIHAAQVKQKYGSLRFYIDVRWNNSENFYETLSDEVKNDIKRTTETVYGAIAMAERMTIIVCENCGQPGKINNGFGWLRCECEGCREARIDRNKEADEAPPTVESLTKRVRELEGMIGDASMTLADWDGYYDEENFTGNADDLACLIDDAYGIMQNGKSCSLRNEKTLRERLDERKQGGGA